MKGRADPPPPRHRLGGYHEYPPPWLLRRVSEAVWLHRTPPEGPVPLATSHRVLPDPALSLAFTCYRDAAGFPHHPRLCVIGPVTTARAFPLKPGFEIAAVKLKLECAESVLGLRPWEHTNAVADAAPAVPWPVDPILEALLATRSVGQAVAILVGALSGRVREARAAAGDAAYALDRVRRSAGRVSVRRLADDMGISPRHLRRVVRRGGGVTLKRFARTLRLLSVVMAADGLAEGRPRWARLAADAGFFDQSHLVRECRALCGMTPDQLHRERREETLARHAPGPIRPIRGGRPRAACV